MRCLVCHSAFALCWICVVNCSSEEGKRFRLVPSDESGIHFRNVLKESVDFNIFNYMYFYNGGGVAVGDVNGDSLPDLYFTSNQEPNKLYLNRGHFKFEDITVHAEVEGFNGWTTGVTMADVNNDGRLDIYVGNLGDYLIFKGKNQLFINEGNDANGIPHFRNRAMEFGLDLVGFATQAAFFDFDRDGDLDMFMLNHSLHENGTFGTAKGLRFKSHPLAGDKLMRNDNGVFIDITQKAGILDNVIGYGLGVVVSDINLDGWPDIYVGNDFHENDYLYINQHNGEFKEVLEKSMNHTSRFTMGVDFADFNNDAFPDLIAMDMLPNDPTILKASAAEDSYDVFNFKLEYGYNYQYSRNTLQLNQGDGTFSEIGLFAGVFATDWSWSSLFADFDLDGHKDIFISNGIQRRSNDLDYINFIGTDSIQMKMRYEMSEKEMSYFNKMPSVKPQSFLFRNNRDSTFTNEAERWGLDQGSWSNGSAYADLDNDGDLDLVVNNVDDEAFVYENETRSEGTAEPTNGYLQFSLQGKPGNRFGIGTKVFLYSHGGLQMQECMPTRGYESSVDSRLTFGLGQLSVVDSVIVVWVDGKFEIMKGVNPNQRIVVDQSKATGVFDYTRFHIPKPIFRNEPSHISFRHRENKFVEFNREALIPQMVSAEGPASAVGDVDGNGLADVYIGGAKWQASSLWLQFPGGKFEEKKQKAFVTDSTYEDVSSIFVDVDRDHDMDLVVVSGGNEFSGNSPMMNPRLYLNDGKAEFTRSKAFEDVFITGSTVSAADIDSDGDVDLFIGARAVPWMYGKTPNSYLLQNDGHGHFKDITDQSAPSLRHVGLVKKSCWTDIDMDGDLDLLIAAEWKPITIFLNNHGSLSEMPLQGSGLENSFGWWNVVYPFDADHDGDMDLVAGNLGLNSKLKASIHEPVRLYVKDFDGNGTVEQILTHYMNGKEYPFCTRDEMTHQLPYLKKKFLSYRKFAEATVTNVINSDSLKGSEQLVATTLETVFIENLGDRHFKIIPLPGAAQFSTTNAVIDGDFDNDGKIDIILGGNFYRTNIQMGRYDASYGVLLKGDGRGGFSTVPNVKSGLLLQGEVRDIKRIQIGTDWHYLAFRNNDSIQAFSLAH